MGKLQGSSVSGFILRSDKKFLIIRRAKDDTFPDLWELPGGGIDYGEDPKVSVQREIYEEVGIEVTVSYPLHVNAYLISGKEKKHTIDVTYLCFTKDNDVKVKLSHEHSKFAWVSFDDLPAYQITPLASTNLAEVRHHILLR